MLNLKYKNFIIFGLIIFTAFFVRLDFVFAQDNLIVQFEKTPLFDEVNFLPGQDVTRWVKVTNDSGQPQRIAAEAINYLGFPHPDAVPADDLSRALLFVIREKNGADLYGGITGEKTLFNFYQDGETYISSDIQTGEFKEYEFEVIFPADKTKEWREKITKFDILVGFQGVGGNAPPGGGTGGGGGLPLGLTIQYEKEFYVGPTSAKISWSTSYKATSQVVYDTVPGKFDLNKLNYGYSFAVPDPEQDSPASTSGVTEHEVWITGLTPGTTYYYRCISHGSFAVSVEHSFTTAALGEKSAEEEKQTVPDGESDEEVGGTQEAELLIEENPEMKEISQAEIKEPSMFLAALASIPFSLKIILIIIALVLIALIILWLFGKKKKKDENK